MMGKLFGTFGVRGVYPDELDEYFAFKLAKAFSVFLKGLKDNPVVFVGRDTRKSGESLKNAFISGLVSSGVDVRDFGVIPTPALQFFCLKYSPDGGAVITASHNPPQFNGIKLLEGNGMGLSRKKEGIVEEIFFSGNFITVDWFGAGEIRKVDMLTEYINEIVKRVDSKRIKEVRPYILVDAGNGAGSLTLPYILEEIGCRVMSLNSHPSGFFTARNPEPNEENLKETQVIVKSLPVDFAVAQDGDADRAVFLDEDGNFVQGDRTFGLAAREVLRKNPGKPVVTTVATSLVIDDIAKEFGSKVYRTKVGDLVVTQKLLEVNGVVGGEENGGVIFPDFTLGRDGAMATAKIVEAFVKSGKAFSELVNELPMYYQKKTKVHVEGDRKEIMNKVKKIVEDFRMKYDATDGVKLLYEDGWVLIRPSGTEPIVRIFGESKKTENLIRYMDEAMDILNKAMK